MMKKRINKAETIVSQTKLKLIVILGQTSTGKSDFAVSLAKSLNKTGTKCEILSADSRQVYKGLDLLSGKITKKEMKGVPHHLLDVVSAKKVFSVADFQKKAAKIITEISKRGNLPILVGGTGFYIDAVVSGQVLPEVPPNLALRKKCQNMRLSDLVTKLRVIDPERAKTIDQKNKVRVIRAIEIATALGKVPKLTTKDIPYDITKIGLTLPEEILKEKIHTRLLKRIKQGMLKEAEALHKSGVSWKRMHDLGLEARYSALYLQKKIDKEEMVSELEKAIWQYAKRQMTWFKRDAAITWINPNKKQPGIIGIPGSSSTFISL